MSGDRMAFASVSPAYAGPNGLPTWPAVTALEELASLRTRTRISMVVSVTLHVLLFAWILFAPKSQAGAAPITEVTLLEPGDLESSPSPAAPAAAPRTSEGVIVSHATEAHFRRTELRSEADPDPQTDATLDDRLNARLAALQQTTGAPSAGTAIGAQIGRAHV